ADLGHGADEQLVELGSVAVGSAEIRGLGLLFRRLGRDQLPRAVEEPPALLVTPEEELAVGQEEDGFEGRHSERLLRALKDIATVCPPKPSLPWPLSPGGREGNKAKKRTPLPLFLRLSPSSPPG